MQPLTSPLRFAAPIAPTRRAADLQPVGLGAAPEAVRRSDVFCTVERRPGLSRPQGSVVSLAG